MSDRAMRADAAHNRELILAAARQLFLDQGPDVPLDRIAQQAGVSIATFYRRFGDRTELIKAVVLDQARQVRDLIEAGIAAIASGGFAAWEACVQSIVSVPNSRLMPALAASKVEALASDPRLVEAHNLMIEAVRRLVRAAHRGGACDRRYAADDVIMFLFAASRPVPLVPVERQDEIRRRLIHVVLAGLRPTAPDA